MSKMNTAGYYAKMFQELDPETLVAVPFIWFKEDVEEAFEETITESEWDSIENSYVENEYLCDTSFETMAQVVMRELANRGDNE